MTGLETLLLLKLLAKGQETTGGPRLPFDNLARIIKKLDALLETRGITVPEEEALTEAERAWLLGETVDAVMLYARSKGLDPVSAMQDLKERLGGVPIIGVVERRVDALLNAEGIVWDASDR